MNVAATVETATKPTRSFAKTGPAVSLAVSESNDLHVHPPDWIEGWGLRVRSLVRILASIEDELTLEDRFGVEGVGRGFTLKAVWECAGFLLFGHTSADLS